MLTRLQPPIRYHIPQLIILPRLCCHHHLGHPEAAHRVFVLKFLHSPSTCTRLKDFSPHRLPTTMTSNHHGPTSLFSSCLFVFTAGLNVEVFIRHAVNAKSLSTIFRSEASTIQGSPHSRVNSPWMS